MDHQQTGAGAAPVSGPKALSRRATGNDHVRGDRHQEGDMLRFLARELHCWRVMHASSNGLVRRADRLETATLVMLWIAALAGLMVALTVGGNTYAAHKATIEHQEPRHSVSATIIRTSVEGVGEPRIGAPSAGVPGVGGHHHPPVPR